MPDRTIRATTIPHTRDSDGRRLLVPCTGHMEIREEDGRVVTRCDECGDGYRFDFALEGRHVAGAGEQ